MSLAPCTTVTLMSVSSAPLDPTNHSGDRPAAGHALLTLLQTLQAQAGWTCAKVSGTIAGGRITILTHQATLVPSTPRKVLESWSLQIIQETFQ